MAIEKHYRRIRSVVRQLGRRDSLEVIWAYAQFLQVADFRIPRGIEVSQQFLDANPHQAILAEWTLEHLAREIIRHADEEPRRGQSLRQWAMLAAAANALRDLEGEIYATLVGAGRIWLEMMRVAHRQFTWQQFRFGWKPMIRYYKVFNTPELNEHAINATGLSVDQIYLISFCYLGIFYDHPRATRQINVEVPGLTQQHVDRFLTLTSLSRSELAERLRAEHALDEGFAYRYSSLRQYPLVMASHHGRDEISCPIPTLLFWRITSGLYYSLRDLKGFPSAFGASFQSYIGEVLKARIAPDRLRVLGETEYHVGHLRKDTVDWIVAQHDEAALFVECKTKRLQWASKAGMTDLSALDQDIRKLAGAVVQTYKTIRDYRAGFYPQLPYLEQRAIYPAIVTLEEWYFFGPDMPTRLESAVIVAMEAAGLDRAWLEEMPYSIMSAHEFETVAGLINAIGIDPFFPRKLRDPNFRRWGHGPYYNDQYRAEIANLAPLFRDEFDAMFADLERAN